MGEAKNIYFTCLKAKAIKNGLHFLDSWPITKANHKHEIKKKMAGRFKSPGAVKDPLSVKIPANPKYKEVRPKVDTGASVTKYLEWVREIKANYKYKKGELFKRIKVTSLVGLMIEVAEINGSQNKSSK